MEMTTTLPPVPSNPARPRRPWRGALYALLLAGGIFAAWQAHELWQPAEGPMPHAPPRATAPPSASPRPRTRPAPRPFSRPGAATQSQPTSVLSGLFPEAGEVEPLDEDPVGVAPPPGATGRRAHRLPDSSVLAQYGWAGSLPQAAKYYEQTLRDGGYTLLDTSTDERGWRYLSFQGQGRRVVVALRQDAPDANMVSIEVTAIPRSR
jgi:hypothetical protein